MRMSPARAGLSGVGAIIGSTVRRARPVVLTALYAWTSLPSRARTANPTTYSAGTPASSSPSA